MLYKLYNNPRICLAYQFSTKVPPMCSARQTMTCCNSTTEQRAQITSEAFFFANPARLCFNRPNFLK